MISKDEGGGRPPAPEVVVCGRVGIGVDGPNEFDRDGPEGGVSLAMGDVTYYKKEYVKIIALATSNK